MYFVVCELNLFNIPFLFFNDNYEANINKKFVLSGQYTWNTYSLIHFFSIQPESTTFNTTENTSTARIVASQIY